MKMNMPTPKAGQRSPHAIFKLTDNRYIDGSNVAEVEFHLGPSKSIFNLTYKHQVDSAGVFLCGEEAKEAWANFQAFFDSLVEREEDATPSVAPSRIEQ